MTLPKQLTPRSVWAHFWELCCYPHSSGNTAALAAHIEAFAAANGIPCTRDAAGNLLLSKPASKGYETHEGVILQGHIDMVAVKEPTCPHDPARDGVVPQYADGWVFADGTSLGGDNGIAVAMAMAVLEDDTLAHPPLTVLLTNDEETGMFGATAVDVSGVTARRLLNLDSEEEGVLTVSCAGGVRACGTLPLVREQRRGVRLTLSLQNLSGGHSGVEIHHGRGNAIKLLATVVRQCMAGFSASLLSLSGGEKENAIPAFATAVLLVKQEELPHWQTLVRALEATLRDRYRDTDPYLTLTLTVGDSEEAAVFTADAATRLLALAVDTPDGVIAKSDFDPTLVQTSLNLGVLRTESQTATMMWSVRSAVTEEKRALAALLTQAATAQGANISFSGEYEAWEYRADSPLRDILVAVWQEMTGQPPEVQGIHAGLECGQLAAKLPGLDAVSFGPTMEGVHTPAERLQVASVERTWNYLLNILEAL